MVYLTVMLVSGPAAFSTRDVWEGYREALSELGIRVIAYPTFSMLRTLSPAMIGNDIVGRALNVRNGVEAVFFVDGMFFQGELSWVPETLRRAGKTTVLIATDDPYHPVKHADVGFSVRFSNEIHSATAGAHYLPTATLAPPPLVKRQESSRERPEYDIAFIGTLFEDRWPLIRRLAYHCEDQQRRMFLGGNMLANVEELQPLESVTLQKRTIRAAEKWEVYRRSKTVLNLFRETDQPAASPNPRIFEVAALGHAALLTGPRRAEITRIFGDSVYQFDDWDSLQDQFAQALADDPARRSRIVRAREIAHGGHLYRHRAQQMLDVLRQSRAAEDVSVHEDRLAWIFGCGRTGSTWLTEMLDDVPGIRSWNEPYFGRLFRHLYDRPGDAKRPPAFFFDGFCRTWRQGIRRLFYDMARQRFPDFGESRLVVKEVNTPEFFALLKTIFPASQYILLIRDPFDILDSYIDMHRAGSWSKHSRSPSGRPGEQSLRRSAEHIRSSLSSAVDAFDDYPPGQRLMLRYEEMLERPVQTLCACATLLSLDLLPEAAERIVEKHRFDRYEETGQLSFRRYGRSGVWRTSGNFDARVSAVAHEVLGGLRQQLGYNSGSESQLPGFAARDSEPHA